MYTTRDSRAVYDGGRIGGSTVSRTTAAPCARHMRAPHVAHTRWRYQTFVVSNKLIRTHEHRARLRHEQCTEQLAGRACDSTPTDRSVDVAALFRLTNGAHSAAAVARARTQHVHPISANIGGKSSLRPGAALRGSAMGGLQLAAIKCPCSCFQGGAVQYTSCVATVARESSGERTARQFRRRAPALQPTTAFCLL